MTTRTMRISLIVALALVAGWLAQPLTAEEIARDYHETFKVKTGTSRSMVGTAPFA